MRTRPTVVGVVVACIVPVILSSAHVQQQQSPLDRFELWTGCLPMRLFVEPLNSDAVGIGLTGDALQAAAESRLRAARLYTADDDQSPHWLRLHVHVTGRAFAVDLMFEKHVFDPASGWNGQATTWNSSAVGTAGGRGGTFIMGVVSRHLDQFLVEYLRVNDSACAGTDSD